MKGAAAIEKYVEAVRELRALEQADKDDGTTPERTQAIKQARVMVTERIRVLTGGQLGQARRVLEGRA
jgi:hypothetical protein